MIQRAFFDTIGEQQREEQAERVINVASVPQRSPFRYPGGNTWLIPYIRRWIGSLPTTADRESKSLSIESLRREASHKCSPRIYPPGEVGATCG